jgi:hypothetical protein
MSRHASSLKGAHRFVDDIDEMTAMLF